MKQYSSDQDELSDFEDITVATTNTTVDYDGYISFSVINVISSSDSLNVYINDVIICRFGGSILNTFSAPVFFYIEKGNTYRVAKSGSATVEYPRARWFKKRDYSNRT